MFPRLQRPGTPVLALLTAAILGFGAVLVSAALHQERVPLRNRALVEQLGLTDLAVFTEARYTRHLALADRHAPFQDHPGALEHFPSGALVAPPSHLTDHAPLAR